MLQSKLYTVAEDDSVGQAIAEGAAKHNYPALERVFDALVWRLARDPTCGTKVSHASAAGIDYYLVRALPLEGAKNPTILARYFIDAAQDRVIVDRIVVLPYKANEAISPREFDIDA